MHLDHQALLARVRVAHLRHAVPRPPNLKEDLALHSVGRGRDGQLRVLHVARRAPCEVRLMLLALRMREVGAFIRVEGKTETTFERAKVVAQDVGVL